ncbi:MAG TPA: transglycosylase SLT domain-containing protein [Gemmatimonadaceae bacterium]|nr:transglycosylase SLT domain-containing protein [Gemmatimonadaceae bacterium]
MARHAPRVLLGALHLALTLVIAAPASAAAQRRAASDRYDDVFRKYSKRFFGPTFDWHYFKAQGIAESGLDPNATSFVGARGIMQLMPSTYAAISSKQSGFGAINDPEWNIAAGIKHDRHLWNVWKDKESHDQRCYFMFGSYNAGEGTIKRAHRMAIAEQLDGHSWTSIETVAPRMRRWRYRETLGYVRKIRATHATMKRSGRERFKSRDSALGTRHSAPADSALTAKMPRPDGRGLSPDD